MEFVLWLDNCAFVGIVHANQFVALRVEEADLIIHLSAVGIGAPKRLDIVISFMDWIVEFHCVVDELQIGGQARDFVVHKILFGCDQTSLGNVDFHSFNAICLSLDQHRCDQEKQRYSEKNK